MPTCKLTHCGLNHEIDSDDYYKVLGVDKAASDADITKAYKKAALKHHPDKNAARKEQAEEEFKRLTEAYEILKCPEKRKTYDQFGKLNGDNPQSGEPAFSFRPGGRQGQSSMSREDADRIFSAFFGGGASPFDIFGDGDNGGAHFMFQSGGLGGGSNGLHGFSSAGDGFKGMHFGGGFPGEASSRPRKQQRGSQRPLVSQGTAVIVHGLTKALQHNGKTGHVVAWDSVKARYEVQLGAVLKSQNILVPGDDDNLCLRPQNMTQLCSVEITGLASKPAMNGCKAEIFNYDDSKHRYEVFVEGNALSLQPANCILSPGTCVVIEGLSKPEFNGQRARVVSIDRAASRYTVECEDGKQMKIKYENVLC